MRTFFACGLLALIANQVDASHRRKPYLSEANSSDFEAHRFVNKLDQFNDADDRTYEQRYWVSDKYFDPENGAVFVYICGEWTCSPPSLQDWDFQVAAKHNSRIYVVEHRYYGDSQPMEDWSTENLKYLSANQALADLAAFIDAQNEQMEKDLGRVPAWVTVGGSYPGALSAWFKHLYPTHAIGSWSSSGVIHAIEDFRNFDLDIYTATVKSGDLCPATIQAHYKFIEHAFENNSDQTEEICDIFNIPVDHLNKHDFFFYLADIYTLGVQYGMRTHLCDFLMANADEDMMTQLKAVADFGNSQGMYYDQYDAVALQDTTIDINLNLRQWTYQYCTEFGFYQTPNLEHPMRSDYIDFEFWPDYCHRIFGDEMPKLDVEETNRVFGGLNITGDNIFFANAEEDPWQWAGMRQIHDPTIQSTMEAEIVECEDCGHCIDLHAQSDAQPEGLTKVQNDIAATVAQWLEEFDAADMFLQA